ncbi:OmpP1/FadL family transporter [Lutibacter sp.]
MKNLLIIAMLSVAYVSNSQTLSYNDIGVLFSKEKINGTARYNAMSGAFGALGGDLSAMDINPAGAAVFLKSEFSATFNVRNTQTTASYYGNSEPIENDYTNLSQTGGVFVFRNYGSNDGWGKIAVGFNYSIANDFENMWFAQGNSNFPTWIDDPNDPNIQYLNSDGQYFENTTSGKNYKYSFTIASQYNDNLYLGASVNTYDVESYQRILLEEYNNDGNGNTLDASLIQELLTYGEGISFTLGLISKPNENIRLGIAYQSPVWYNLLEDYVGEDLELYLSNTNEIISSYSGINTFDYKLRTPSKLTGSFAYIFNNFGLISFDYIYKNYSKISLSNGNFVTENQSFLTDMESTGEFRLGTEWRFKNLSLRGGYHYEKSPYKSAITSDNVEGFSIGVGYKFRGGKIDFSYQKDTNTAPYNFYPQYNQVNSANLDFENSIFTTTIVFNI